MRTSAIVIKRATGRAGRGLLGRGGDQRSTRVGSLARRITALEEIAPPARLRPYPAIAAELGCPLEELMAETDREQARYGRLLAGGATVRQVLEQVAAEHGITVEALEVECEAIERRYF